MTSAIAIRDFNASSSSSAMQRQVLIMNDRSQGASAGLRDRKNIEIMHHRRYKQANESKSTNDPLNDLEGSGKGLQVKATYYMQVANVAGRDAQPVESAQRRLQRQTDQPLLFYYSQDYELPASFNSNLTTAFKHDLSVLQSIHTQLESAPESGWGTAIGPSDPGAWPNRTAAAGAASNGGRGPAGTKQQSPDGAEGDDAAAAPAKTLKKKPANPAAGGADAGAANGATSDTPTPAPKTGPAGSSADSDGRLGPKPEAAKPLPAPPMTKAAAAGAKQLENANADADAPAAAKK
jgi:hypothetical protein